MNILIACEESQRICIEFRKRGFNAFSCDIQECSGGHPEWHIHSDCLPLLNGNTEFETMDGVKHKIEGKWDLLIAHPNCTHLAVSEARHFEKKRADGRQREAIEFFYKFVNADCDRIAIENPIGIISGDYIKKWYDINPLPYSQIIQPYEYGDPFRKSTCLWLKGLPNLVPTNIVEFETIHSKGKSGGYSGALWNVYDENGKAIAYGDPRVAKERSKTFKGIAEAIANQWGDYLMKENENA